MVKSGFENCIIGKWMDSVPDGLGGGIFWCFEEKQIFLDL